MSYKANQEAVSMTSITIISRLIAGLLVLVRVSTRRSIVRVSIIFKSMQRKMRML